MSPRSAAAIFALFVLSTIQSAECFAPAALGSAQIPSHLDLVPEQGRQLVAFSQAALAKKAKESATKASNLTSRRRSSHRNVPRSDAPRPRVAAAARSFVTRLLGVGGETRSLLPPTSGATSLSAQQAEPECDDDIVLYPIVGFNLVEGQALPMVQSVSCNLKNGHEEKVFGWYHNDDPDKTWL